MEKKLYVIHGWSCSPQEPMLAWIISEAKKIGFEVVAPIMPHPDEPTIGDWVNNLNVIVTNPDQNTYFVGHSVGCQTVLRYLEKQDNVQVGGVILIAPWLILSNLETEEEKVIGKPWIETPIDFNKVKQAARSFTAIFSDDDPVVPFEKNKELFSKYLNPQVIVEHDKGHFTEGDGVQSLQSVIDTLNRF